MNKKLHSLILVALVVACSRQPKLEAIQGYALGTTYGIQYQAIEEEKEIIQQGIDSIFNLVNHSMSTYLPDSDISKVNRGDSLLQVDEHFKAVFDKANLLWYKTQGYFDPTVGAWVNAYGFGPDKALKQINPAQQDSLMKITGWARIQMTPDRRIIKDNPNIYIDFNAIAKGYTVDLIERYLSQKGSQNHLVEIGGEVVGKGMNPKSGEGWKIGIDNPKQGEERSLQSIVSLNNEALATSGNYRKFRVDKNSGEKYVHSINPLNGRPVRSKVLSVSVKAPDCMTADAYATALMVMSFERGKTLVESMPELSAYWILAKGIEVEEVISSRW